MFGEMNNPTEMKHEKRGVRRTSQGRTGSLSKENSFRGVNGGPASIIPNFQSLGLRKMSLQSKRSIVELPVPPAAAAGVSALAGSSLTLDGELMKFIMPSGELLSAGLVGRDGEGIAVCVLSVTEFGTV